MKMEQHREAERLLSIIEDSMANNRSLTYGSASEALGRDPATNSRMVAQVCDLLDAAAAFAGVPLLALIAVREKAGGINRKAWRKTGAEYAYRDQIIDRSLAHRFSKDDFWSISDALQKLDGKGNRSAWALVREMYPEPELYQRLVGSPLAQFDAIADIGTDTPDRRMSYGVSYARDLEIRHRVMQRANGTCEFCREPGFLCPDGTRYLECHHIIALAKEGADRMTNVIALCPNDHREAHFGARAEELEREMIGVIKRLATHRG
jgi:hypothetical protein